LLAIPTPYTYSLLPVFLVKPPNTLTQTQSTTSTSRSSFTQPVTMDVEIKRKPRPARRGYLIWNEYFTRKVSVINTLHASMHRKSFDINTLGLNRRRRGYLREPTVISPALHPSASVFGRETPTKRRIKWTSTQPAPADPVAPALNPAPAAKNATVRLLTNPMRGVD